MGPPFKSLNPDSCADTSFLKVESVLYVLSHAVYGQSDLLHCIAISYGDAAVLLSIEVNAYTERSADLVLSPVSLAYGARLVVIDGEVF